MEEQNEILNEKVSAENELKDIIINYVGEQINPENDEVTVEMEFLLVIAEENFLRGYQQAFADVEAHEKMKNEEKSG